MASKPKLHRKHDFPVDRTREHFEPGPIVMISSTYKGERNIMTLGWHMMLEYSVVGCYVWDANHSFELFRRSRECVINVPTRELFIWDVVKAHVAPVKNPRTLHYRGQGVFRLAEGSVNRRRLFEPDRLE